MLRIQELKLPLDADRDALWDAAARSLRLDRAHIRSLSIWKRAVDARKKEDIHLNYTVDVELDADEGQALRPTGGARVARVEPYHYELPPVRRDSVLRPVVVGFGPAGMFTALLLARAGLRPIVLERGRDVDTRMRDVERFWTRRILDGESNVQFGEGGAGTFSDGKLTTGIKDPRCRKVLLELAAHGAPEEILYCAKPHIGTDRLAQVVKRLRGHIIALGGEIRFGVKLTGLIVANGVIHGVACQDASGGSRDVETDAVVLAVGHSARDTMEMLHASGVRMIQKPFSIGARIEHPQALIDRAQYGRFAGHPALGAADYKLSCHPPHGRGAYTFCMCPGGTVVAAASEQGGVVVNGMSAYARDTENANSALLVGVEPAEFPSEHPLAGMYYQRQIEQAAFRMGGGDYHAPAQLVGDFLAQHSSVRLGTVRPTCPTGVALADLNSLLPARVAQTMREAIVQMDRRLEGFALPDAVLTGPETRSSSPVRMLRDEFFQANIRGLYPCGEGAGYAGGIVSAAVDGIRAAEAILSDEP